MRLYLSNFSVVLRLPKNCFSLASFQNLARPFRSDHVRNDGRIRTVSDYNSRFAGSAPRHGGLLDGLAILHSGCGILFDGIFGVRKSDARPRGDDSKGSSRVLNQHCEEKNKRYPLHPSPCDSRDHYLRLSEEQTAIVSSLNCDRQRKRKKTYILLRTQRQLRTQTQQRTAHCTHQGEEKTRRKQAREHTVEQRTSRRIRFS